MPRGLHVKDQTFGSLMRESTRIAVPIYQRDYAWKKDQLDDLWEDLLHEVNDEPLDRNLFLGAIVFNVETRRGQTESDLVDGQQRLTTLSLLLGALWHRLGDVETRKSGRLQERIEEMLFDRNVRPSESWEQNDRGWSLRLRPNAKDRDNFATMMFRGNQRDGRHMIASAWRDLHNRILQAIVPQGSDELEHGSQEWEDACASNLVNLAQDIVDVIDSNTCFAVIEVSEPHNPFVVFESLNSKGLELAQSDLIKNFLLMQLPPEDRERAVRMWDDFSRVVGDPRLVDFLRHSYIAKHRRIPKGAVYTSYRSLLSREEAIWETLSDLERNSHWYAALLTGSIDDSHPEMQGTRVVPSFSRALDRFSRINFTQGRPILLAFLEGLDPRTRQGQEALSRAMEVLEVAFVRLFVTGNTRASVVEAALNRLCAAARSGPDAGLDTLRRVTRDLCEEEGVAGPLDWSQLQPTLARARFLLYRIAEHRVGEGLTLGDPDQWHVEHILPQTRNDTTLPGIDEETYEALVANIGNLTLLLSYDNQSLRNVDYGDKCRVYAWYDGSHEEPTADGTRIRPKFPMNEELGERWSTWDDISIEGRAKHLAKFADDVWPLV